MIVGVSSTKIAFKAGLYHLGPVVQKAISVNPGLKFANPGLNFKPRLICVAQSSISLNPMLKLMKILTHLARWINFLTLG